MAFWPPASSDTVTLGALQTLGLPGRYNNELFPPGDKSHEVFAIAVLFLWAQAHIWSEASLLPKRSYLVTPVMWLLQSDQRTGSEMMVWETADLKAALFSATLVLSSLL